MDNFYNKNVLITGSSQLVMELAKQFSKEKANIILLTENKKDMADVESEIDKMRGRVTVYLKDLSTQKNIDKMVDRIIRDNDRVDVVINCGMSVNNNSFFESKLQDIKNNVKNNSFNGMLVSNNFLPYMISCGKGYIVNIGPEANNENGFSEINNAVLKSFSNSLEKYLKNSGQKEIASLYVEKSSKNSNDVAVSKIIAAMKKNKTEIKI